MQPKYSYRQSYKQFEESPQKHARSHAIATQMVAEALHRGVCLEDMVRRCLPRLSIPRLERIHSLVCRILASKLANREKFAEEGHIHKHYENTVY